MTGHHGLIIVVDSVKRWYYLHLSIAAPDGQFKHEVLDGMEEGIHCGQSGIDDHVSGCVSFHVGVSISVSTHPGPKIEQIVGQGQRGLANLHGHALTCVRSHIELLCRWACSHSHDDCHLCLQPIQDLNWSGHGSAAWGTKGHGMMYVPL